MAMAALHTRADGTELEWRGGSQQPSSVRPSVRPSGKQLTAGGRGHSRAAFQSPSLRNVIHSPSADLLSDLQLGGAAAARRRLGGGSEPHSSRATRCDGAAVLRPKLARPDNQASRAAGRGRSAPGLAEISTLYTKKTTGFPGSLARSVSPVFPFLQSRIDSMKSGSDPFARVRPPRHPSRSDSSSVRPSDLGWQTTQTNRGDRGQTGPGGRAQSRIHGWLR